MRAMVTEMKPGPSRRAVLGGLALSAAAPMGTWAAAGGARFLSAAKLGEEDYALIGLTGEGEEAFRLKLPGVAMQRRRILSGRLPWLSQGGPVILP